MLSRRMFSTSMLAGAAVALLPAAARSQNAVKARNVVLVHGAYADGSSWLEVPHSTGFSGDGWKSYPTSRLLG